MQKNKQILFVLLAISGLLAAFYYYQRQEPDHPTQEERRVKAILTGSLELPLAPENISSIPLYQLHLNLWDTLLESNGEPGLARLIGVEESGKVFKFELRSGARFSNGRTVSTDDVVFSMNRLIHKQPGGHFNARLIIDHIEPVSPSQFNIRLKEPTPAFQFLLTIPEMGIVPKESCDQDGNVRNLSVTSGAYYVVGTPTETEIALRKNPYFARHDPKSPTEIEVLFKSDFQSILNEASDRSSDFFEFYDGVGLKAFETLKVRPDFEYLTTRPSYSIFAVMNSARLSLPQRSAIYDLINSQIENYYHPAPGLEKRSFELLPPETFGSMELTAPLKSEEKSSQLPTHLVVATGNKAAPLPQAVVAVLEGAHIQVKYVGAEEKNYDLFVRGQGMNADFPEIEFHLSMLSEWASIPPTPLEKSEILAAMHSETRELRNIHLKAVGKSLLANRQIVPLYVRSYVHLFRRGKITADRVTTYDGDIPFWKMQVNE